VLGVPCLTLRGIRSESRRSGRSPWPKARTGSSIPTTRPGLWAPWSTSSRRPCPPPATAPTCGTATPRSASWPSSPSRRPRAFRQTARSPLGGSASRAGSGHVRRLYVVHRSTVPAFDAPDIDTSAPDSLPHACTRRAQARESLGRRAVDHVRRSIAASLGYPDFLELMDGARPARSSSRAATFGAQRRQLIRRAQRVSSNCSSKRITTLPLKARRVGRQIERRPARLGQTHAPGREAGVDDAAPLRAQELYRRHMVRVGGTLSHAAPPPLVVIDGVSATTRCLLTVCEPHPRVRRTREARLQLPESPLELRAVPHNGYYFHKHDICAPTSGGACSGVDARRDVRIVHGSDLRGGRVPLDRRAGHCSFCGRELAECETWGRRWDHPRCR